MSVEGGEHETNASRTNGDAPAGNGHDPAPESEGITPEPEDVAAAAEGVPPSVDGDGDSTLSGGDGLPAGMPTSCSSLLNEDEQAAALELEYRFPGFVPMVVVAHRSEVFETMLTARIEEVQGDDPYDREDRLSSKGTYVSYRLQLFVPDARAAITRRSAIAELPGIKMLL